MEFSDAQVVIATQAADNFAILHGVLTTVPGAAVRSSA